MPPPVAVVQLRLDVSVVATMATSSLQRCALPDVSTAQHLTELEVESGAYKHLMNKEDMENLEWLKIFNKYDLYSKSKIRVDVEKVKPYYLSLIEKYFPAKLRW
ncbi:unnamed protein product [Fraxinus pennsylvanica]|uniref:Inositol oxygenase n=1 Tax=Fraxinus pennsylvanica TaxID=56036 RepID=A0AAD1ZAY8_9LAMI|nr:unnamed protein product [Fraxinus pennsylvanica]